ncbi:hypothetical protein [Staphylococcus aureus]|uniref:hypothetical protein n=1 Tax=Staphylococcus aureus TaxID=1280 RepID=UPI0021B0C23F|nr:hypothetical protein [Staphylococcus aureus]MCT6558710.1 hypothetical protein [Staphylococcus aureus]
MSLKLISKYNSEFVQDIINQINVTLENIEDSSIIEVIFDIESNYTRYQFQNNKLHIKNILPNLIDLLGVEDGVDTFMRGFNEGFYEVLTRFIDASNLDDQFEEYKNTISTYLFTSKGKLKEHILLKLHNDNSITLDDATFKSAVVNAAFGYKNDIDFKFYIEHNSNIVSLDKMLNAAFTIKNGLERKDYVYSKPFSSSYSHQEWENLNNIADTSTLISMRMNDKNDELFQIHFTKEQVASSVIQTLLSKFDHIDDDEEVELNEKLNTFIGKLSKDKRRGRYSLSDLLTILSIFYFRYLYIDSKNTNKSKNSQGVNSYFATLFNLQELNTLKNNSVKYSELLEVAVQKHNLNSDFRQLHNDINDLTKYHLSISYKDYNDLSEELDFSNISSSDYIPNKIANLFIHKLFFMDQIPSTEVLISTLKDIYCHICENINFFHTSAPDEILNLSTQLTELTKAWSNSITTSPLKKNLTKTNAHKNSSFLSICDFKIIKNTHLSLINTMNIINNLHLRKKYYKKY